MKLILILAIAAFGLCGCGFQKMYEQANISRFVVDDGAACNNPLNNQPVPGKPGATYAVNCYLNADRSVHIWPSTSPHTVVHEICHGWESRNVPLYDWKQTPEGADFPGDMEQAADVCASFYLNTPIEGEYISTVNPYWYTWQKKWLPQ